MKRQDYLRRDFMKICGPSTAASVLSSATSVRAAKLRKNLFRFAAASDIRFGRAKTPFEKTAENMVRWFNPEKEKNGLDLIVLNGDLVHDSSALSTVNRVNSRWPQI